MRDAKYLRTHAELCLKIAHQMSDETTADKLRAEADRHLAEAAEIESRPALSNKNRSRAELVGRLVDRPESTLRSCRCSDRQMRNQRIGCC